MKRIYIFSVLLILLYFLPNTHILGQNDWAAEHQRLQALIDEHYNEPPPTENDFEVWLQWIQTKAQHRNQVQAVLDEINALYIKDPDNDYYNQWVQNFYKLLEHANESGNRTVNDAAGKFIRFGRFDKCPDWLVTSRTVHYWGRRLFTTANNCSFDTYVVRERSRCLINYSIGDLESSCTGGGLYEDRDLRFGYMDDEGYMNLPDRDFNVECERRGEFERFSEGRPQRTIDWAITEIDKLRDECGWWEFIAEKQDATDLLNEYYEDALCKEPPHKGKMGHKYFLDLAKETEGMGPSVEYNEGFYGTLYGKVEIREDGQLKPAPYARVYVDDFEQKWNTTADTNGEYEIQDIILHKECSPFYISAEHEDDWEHDTYEGPLEKPDKSYRHKKDLVIRPKRQYTWSGTITLYYNEKLECNHEIEYESEDSEGNKVKNTDKIMDANLSFKANDKGTGTGLIQLSTHDMDIQGTIMAKYHNTYELNTSSKYNKIYEINKSDASQMFMAKSENWSIQVANQNLADKAKIQQLAMEIMQSGGSEAEVEALNKKVDDMMNANNAGVKIIVQYLGMESSIINHYQHRERYSKPEGTTVDHHNEISEPGPITLPVSVEMDGTMVKDEKNGSVQIRGQFFKSEEVPDMDKDCPPIIKTVRCTLNMNRKRQKNQ
ncbi:MAG: hypothetical protein WBN17_04395 [Aureibaculum sp.]